MKKSSIFTALPLAAMALTFVAMGSTSCASSHDVGYVPDMTVDTRGTTITLWTGFGAKVQSTLEPILEDFTKITGVNVKAEYKGGYPALQSAVNLAATSGEYPNIVNGYPDHFVGYLKSDIILRLDGYIEKDSQMPKYKDEAGNVLDDPINTPFDYNDFYENYRTENEEIEFDENGKGYILGVPFNKSTELGTYNKTMLDVLKHFDATIKIPETWDELKTEGKKMQNVLATAEGGLYGKLIGKNFKAYATDEALQADKQTLLLDLSSVSAENFKVLSYNSCDNWFITGVRQFGGQYTSSVKGSGKGYVEFDSPETRVFMNKMLDLFNDGLLGIPATWELKDYCSGAFVTSKSLINIGSSAGVEYSVPAGNAFEVGVCPILYEKPDAKYVISQGTNLCLLDRGTDAERVASWQLLKYLSQQRNAEFVIGTGYYPTGKSVAESKVYQDYLESKFEKAGDVVKKESAKLNTVTYNGKDNGWKFFVDTPFSGSSFIREQVRTIMASLFYPTEGSTSNIDKIISDILKILNDYVRK